MIKSLNLLKKFESGDSELIALNNLSFEIPQGQFVAITGRSGSGKSTLLYQLGLLDQPTGGQVYVDGVDATALSNEDRTTMRLTELGYIFQDYALIPELTASENVMIPLLMKGMSLAEAEIQANLSLERIGLAGKYGNLPSQLSGGQQQRVSIARAIAHKPKIIFADEPTANLDSETSEVVLNAFIELNNEGQTIVMVTHEPEYAKRTHRTITLADGEIVSDTINTK